MKAIDPNSRTQRILRFIESRHRPVSHEDIVAAVRADAADAKTKDLGNKVAATLAMMVKTGTGNLQRFGLPREYRYTTKSAMVPKPQPGIAERERSSNSRRPGEFRVVDKPAPFCVPNAALTPPRLGQISSEQIAAHIAAFEKRGGRIEKLKQGESSYSIRAKQEAFLESRGRGQSRPKASASAAVSRTLADNDDTLDADDQADVA